MPTADMELRRTDGHAGSPCPQPRAVFCLQGPYRGVVSGCCHFVTDSLCPTLCVRLFVTPCTAARQAPLSMGFSRQEYLSGLPCPSPGDLPDPGIEPGSPALQAYSYCLNLKGSLWVPLSKAGRGGNGTSEGLEGTQGLGDSFCHRYT